MVVAAVGASFDFRTGEIPNWLTLGALCLAPLAHFGMTLSSGRPFDVSLQALGLSILGAAVCALVPLLLYKYEGFLGGDVKLLAAIGALLGPRAGIEAELFAVIAAAIYALGLLAYQGKLMQVFRNTATLAFNPFRPKDRRRELTPEMLTKMRFGPSIFVGTCTAALTNWRSS
jgi:prepilin peptidase CpaA